MIVTSCSRFLVFGSFGHVREPRSSRGKHAALVSDDLSWSTSDLIVRLYFLVSVTHRHRCERAVSQDAKESLNSSGIFPSPFGGSSSPLPSGGRPAFGWVAGSGVGWLGAVRWFGGSVVRWFGVGSWVLVCWGVGVLGRVLGGWVVCSVVLVGGGGRGWVLCWLVGLGVGFAPPLLLLQWWFASTLSLRWWFDTTSLWRQFTFHLLRLDVRPFLSFGMRFFVSLWW